MKFENSKKLYEEACKVVAGGISSQIRINEPGSTPLFFSKSKGSKLWDVDGNEYIDYIQGMGPNIFGHAPDFIIDSVKKDMEKGFIFAGQFKKEIEVAKMALEMIPMKNATVRFASSGTEIDQLAIRLMRGYTGRNKFIKFEGHYHGWTDSISYSVHPDMNKSGDILSPLPVPESYGIDKNTSKSIAICGWNDLSLLEKTFEDNKNQIAGVIMEPILANTNCIYPEKGYLQGVKEICKKNDALLCFDEVITGFRIAQGGAQEVTGVIPDLATYAKSMAGGFPIAMLVGKKEIMNSIGSGKVYHGGSFNSNVMSISAAEASLKYLKSSDGEVYKKMNKIGNLLIEELNQITKSSNPDLHIQGNGSLFAISFTTKEKIIDWRDHKINCNEEKYKSFTNEMINHGIRLSSNGRMHISSAHTEDDISKTVEATKLSLRNI
ncbi:MAG: aspartate aminotransferase family protein [Chloroflexi bacterium]|nr:aspartate aminotransferase family protein [Chloroflexota bacterium]|tara:strand:- start:67755 stop:69062 length:1308 start_codon:yes stop_codon:yes gene_type:complete